MGQIKRHKTYRNSKPTTSLLTITSNVVYGKNTGNTPDGREAGKPLAPGANPSYNAEQSGLLASLNSTAKMNYGCALMEFQIPKQSILQVLEKNKIQESKTCVMS